MYLYDSKTSKELDKIILKSGEPAEQTIMKAAFEIWSLSTKLVNPRKVWCLSGPGNNGADAVGVAGLSLISKKPVTLILMKPLTGASMAIFRFMKLLNLRYVSFLPKLNEISKDDLIIDGLVGTGLSRSPDPWLEKAIEWINQAKKRGATVISIDTPSGLDATSGAIFKNVVSADATVMCLSPKQGCYTGMAPRYTGTLYHADLGYQDLQKLLPGTSQLLTQRNLGKRKRTTISHKGNFGNLLILGGWDEMAGAGNLAAKAALKVGAGKVFLCGSESKNRPHEVIGVKRDINIFKSVLNQIDCILAGPGLGKNADKFLHEAWISNKPLVLDADGLNWLSKATVSTRKGLLIGTPHTGEAKTLLKQTIDNRFDAIHKLKKIYGGDWILKGAGTLVATSNKIYVNPFANSILATAGSGDVLAGLVGGLLSQNIETPALTGVWLQSEAARIYLEEGESTILAGDILLNISKAFRKLENM